MGSDWSSSASTMLLGYVWIGLDALWKNHLKGIGGVKSEDEAKELSITELLFDEIREVMPSASPFEVGHKVSEFESLLTPSAHPPEYDIAFYPRQNRRLKFPIEAKVLPTDGQVSEYNKEINENYLTCRYAPLSSEGAMLGYLLRGSPGNALNNISQKVPCKLEDHPEFKDRDHKVSNHDRKIPEGKSYPSRFRCHHMIFKVGEERISNKR